MFVCGRGQFFAKGFKHRIKWSCYAFAEHLEKTPADKKRQRKFFGLLSGYIVALTGHRKGVVLNMTRKEVKAAEKLKNGDRIIRVSTTMLSAKFVVW